MTHELRTASSRLRGPCAWRIPPNTNKCRAVQGTNPITEEVRTFASTAEARRNGFGNVCRAILYNTTDKGWTWTYLEENAE